MIQLLINKENEIDEDKSKEDKSKEVNDKW